MFAVGMLSRLRWRALWAVVVLVAVWVAAFLAQPSGSAVVESGVLWRVSGNVERPVDAVGFADRSVGPGSFSFVAVRATPVSKLMALWGSLNGQAFVELDADALPAVVAMDDAKMAASIAARRFAGFDVGLVPAVRVLSTRSQDDGRSVSGRLAVGDVFVSVAGRRVGLLTEVMSVWPTARTAAAGTVASGLVPVVVVRAGREVVLSLPVGGVPAGVSLGEVLVLEQDERFDVVSGGVGGGSGGLMFALGFLDELSPGDLTAGLTVAGTGSLDIDGVVGGVVAVDVKAQAAVSAGVDVFFYPAGADVEQGGLPLVMVPVSSLRDAVIFLCGRGASDTICGTGL
jgi:PDZ domain-containing secreted protein